jgi:hypothetical protein
MSFHHHDTRKPSSTDAPLKHDGPTYAFSEKILMRPTHFKHIMLYLLLKF